MKTFFKKYWWLVLPLPLIALYWLWKNSQSTPPAVPGASQTETGGPASDSNNQNAAGQPADQS